VINFIYCPECEHEVTFSHSADIAKGQTLRCEKCGTDFNIFTVYKSFYEDIPIAKKIADAMIALANKKYEVRGNADDVGIINDFFEKMNFDRLYDQVISDLIIYANAFVEKDSEQVTIVRHDPATSILNTELATRRNLREEVVYLTTKEGKTIPSGNLTHSAVNTFEPPFGESPYGQWFNDWYILKLSPNALINASILRNQGYVARRPEELSELKKAAEKRVILGAGLDPATFDETLPPNPYTRDLPLIDAEHIQTQIVSLVERELFPFILKHELDHRSNNLRFIIEGYEE
jgi:hypothetical protein